MSILISHESPIQLLNQSRKYNDYDYCLVHLLEKYPEYALFFKQSLLMGREVLLDNSIFELGHAFDPEKYIEVVRDMNPTFYIVPDTLEDSEKTIEQYKNWNSTYLTNSMRIGVVQGKTYKELTDCYKFMSEHADYIAISFDYSYYLLTSIETDKIYAYADGRHRFIRQLIADNIWNWNKPHHLLGAGQILEFSKYRDIKNIRSLDTSSPIMAGIHNHQFIEKIGNRWKPKDMLANNLEIDLTTDQLDLISHNIKVFRDIVSNV